MATDREYSQEASLVSPVIIRSERGWRTHDGIGTLIERQTIAASAGLSIVAIAQHVASIGSWGGSISESVVTIYLEIMSDSFRGNWIHRSSRSNLNVER
jgi:hypothetical protein